MKLTIDRIEGDIAVGELFGDTVHIPVSALPNACEGAVYELTARPIAADDQDDQARLERLRQTSPSGDTIDL